MAKKSYNDYVKEQDLEGIYERFMNAPANWKNHWWEGVVEIFKSCAEFAKKYTLDLVHRALVKSAKIIEEAVTRISTKDVKITVNPHLEEIVGKQCYLFKFFDSNGKILFTKIGTTTRKYMTRLREEIRGYRKSGFDIASVHVADLFDCGKFPAEGYESLMRAKFIKQFPDTWHRNDRFFGVDIPVADFRAVCNMFATL